MLEPPSTSLKPERDRRRVGEEGGDLPMGSQVPLCSATTGGTGD